MNSNGVVTDLKSGFEKAQRVCLLRITAYNLQGYSKEEAI